MSVTNRDPTPLPTRDPTPPPTRDPTPPPNREGGVLLAQAKEPLPRIERDARMTRALRQNHGIITRKQLVGIGFSDYEIFGLEAHGELRRLHRAVYADGRAPLSDHAHLLAACLALGGRGWLSGRAAAMGWGLLPLNLPSLEVTVHAASTPAQRTGLRIRSVRTPPYPSDVRTRNGLRVSSVPRMLIEVAAAGATRAQLGALIETAVRKDLLDVERMDETLNRHAGARGVKRVRQACADYLPRDSRKSGLERSFDRWLSKHPEIPEPERNIRLGPWEIDCHWPEQRLALELDGRPYHIVVEEIERDRRKDAWLQIHGTRILRVTDARWKRDRRGVHHDLMAMLAPAADLDLAA